MLLVTYYCYWLHIGLSVAQLVEVLGYKTEDRGFDSRCCPCSFSFTSSFRPHYGPGVDSVPNRNEYQECILVGKSGRCGGLTTLSPLCTDCSEIWEPEPSGTFRASPGLRRSFCSILLYVLSVPAY